MSKWSGLVFIVAALTRANVRQTQPADVRLVLTLFRGSFLQRSPRRCSCGLRARAVLLCPSTALQKRSSTCSGPCGLHESPAHRSRCHKAARDIVPLTASFPDRSEATFLIPSRSPESVRICLALSLRTQER